MLAEAAEEEAGGTDVRERQAGGEMCKRVAVAGEEFLGAVSANGTAATVTMSYTTTSSTSMPGETAPSATLPIVF